MHILESLSQSDMKALPDELLWYGQSDACRISFIARLISFTEECLALTSTVDLGFHSFHDLENSPINDPNLSRFADFNLN